MHPNEGRVGKGQGDAAMTSSGIVTTIHDSYPLGTLGEAGHGPPGSWRLMLETPRLRGHRRHGREAISSPYT